MIVLSVSGVAANDKLRRHPGDPVWVQRVTRPAVALFHLRRRALRLRASASLLSVVSNVFLGAIGVSVALHGVLEVDRHATSRAR